MLLQEIQNLINLTENASPNITSPIVSKLDDNDPSFIKRHKKKILGATALAAIIYAAKKGKLPQPFQTTADSITSAGNSLATGLTNKLRQATGQTTLADVFTDRETVKGYLKNKDRMIKNILSQPHV
jgi:hypothetical protein